jgi:hypothetical protein
MTKKKEFERKWGRIMSSEKDDFWDISSLLPPKKKYTASVFADTVPTAEISLDASNECVAENERTLHFSVEDRATASFREYTPPANAFIHRVCVRRAKSRYRFFHVFREDAIRYLNAKAKVSAFIPFFSYIPQYSQMNKEQLDYYIYFRNEANEGRYIQTTQSYYFLYIYEIINLPEYIPAEIGVVRMAKAWAAYRKMIPSIEKYMVSWLADYALIHGVACPVDILSPFLPDILALSHFKEFYLGNAADSSEAHLEALLALCSKYHYKNGRYAAKEQGEYFLTHIPRALELVFHEVFESDTLRVMYDTVSKEYDAYCGALCAEEYRYTVSVQYSSLTGTEALGQLITAAVKYAENKVRAYLSIKSRLSVPMLPQKYKSIMDAYFARSLVQAPRKEREARPEYEALYDAPSLGISDDAAKEIELSSWQNTRRLVPEEELCEATHEESADTGKTYPSAFTDKREGEDACPLLKSEMDVLRALRYENEASARACAKSEGVYFESALEHINEYFFDRMGDIVIEINECGVSVLEDYETEVGAFLAAHKSHA